MSDIICVLTSGLCPRSTHLRLQFLPFRTIFQLLSPRFNLLDFQSDGGYLLTDSTSFILNFIAVSKGNRNTNITSLKHF